MMETRASGTWTAPNGERADVTLQALPDGDGRFGGVYVTAATALSSGRPSSAIVAVTVEDDEGNAYDYTPVALNMGLCAKLPERFFAPSYPTNNAPMPSRLKWTVTGVRMMDGTGAWQSCTGDPVTLDYYPAGRFGASGELLTQYPWRWWWGEDCEAPVPMSRELIPTEGNPIAISFSSEDASYSFDSVIKARDSYPFIIMGPATNTNGYCQLSPNAQSQDDFLWYPALTVGQGVRGQYVHVFGIQATEEDTDGCLFAMFNIETDDGHAYISGDFECCIGLLTGLDASDFTVLKPESDGDDFAKYSAVEQIGGAEVYPLGFQMTGSPLPVDKLVWLRLRIKGGNPVNRAGYVIQINYPPVIDKQPQWLAFGVLQLGNVPPTLNPYTNNYAPFVISRGACRDDILSSPKHRGRLTHMRLPDCQIDYYVKWWDKDGTCYVLPYSVAGETVEAQQDGTPLYEGTRTLRLVSPSLAEEERKDALTVAASPRVAIRPYGGEWTFARLKDYSTTWELSEEDEGNVELEVIVNYGKSDN